MKTLVMTATLISAIGATPVMAAGSWLADGAYEVRTTAGELATESGRSALLAEVRRAAVAICADEVTRGSRDRCVETAIATAMDSGATPAAQAALKLALKERGAPQMQARSE